MAFRFAARYTLSLREGKEAKSRRDVFNEEAGPTEEQTLQHTDFRQQTGHLISVAKELLQYNSMQMILYFLSS